MILLTFTEVHDYPNLGNAVAHAHYHPCNEYQTAFPLPLPNQKAAWGRGYLYPVMRNETGQDGVSVSRTKLVCIPCIRGYSGMRTLLLPDSTLDIRLNACAITDAVSIAGVIYSGFVPAERIC